MSQHQCSLYTEYDDTIIPNSNLGSSRSTYILEIYGLLNKSSQYIATALSTDDKMGKDSVMACILDPKTGTNYKHNVFMYNTY